VQYCRILLLERWKSNRPKKKNIYIYNIIRRRCVVNHVIRGRARRPTADRWWLVCVCAVCVLYVCVCVCVCALCMWVWAVLPWCRVRACLPCASVLRVRRVRFANYLNYSRRPHTVGCTYLLLYLLSTYSRCKTYRTLLFFRYFSSSSSSSSTEKSGPGERAAQSDDDCSPTRREYRFSGDTLDLVFR